METIGIYLISIAIVFVLLILVLGIIIIKRLGNKKIVRATLFLKSGSQKKFNIDRVKSKTTTVDDCVYTFDEKAVRKTAWNDFIYYKEGISAPLLFDKVEVQSNMTPSELKTILEDDLLKQLFSDDQLKTLQIILIITLIVCVITLLAVLFSSFSGVTIKDNEANRELLTNITQSVIRGF